MPEPAKIKKLELSVGGYFADNHLVRYEKGMLIHECDIRPYPPGFSENMYSVKPTEAQWQSFIRSMKRITNDWQKEYVMEEICDGTQWSIKIRSNAFNCNFYGSNEFPSNWNSYIRVVRRLLNNKIFAGRIPDDHLSW